MAISGFRGDSDKLSQKDASPLNFFSSLFASFLLETVAPYILSVIAISLLAQDHLEAKCLQFLPYV